jgi:UDP-N-acetyl-2-amino-2-deoxyglucuronate dehydrogenase
VLNPWNVDALAEIEKETSNRIYTILQLRLHPSINALREKIMNGPKDKTYNVDLQYITSRGDWYNISWKGDMAKSGGVATNIGIHFFDMLIYIFGAVKLSTVKSHRDDHAEGYIELERAMVNWFLSINQDHLPQNVKNSEKRTYRSLTIENEELEFSEGFTDLHTLSYQQILESKGFGINEAKMSIEVVHNIRQAGKTNS